MTKTKWMSWEAGLDLVAFTKEGLKMPNLIIHMARVVHTPVGSAPAGMLLLPNEDGSPKLMAFVSDNIKVAEYFGPNIFAGTPFENAEVKTGKILFSTNFPDDSSVVITVDDIQVEMTLSVFGELTHVNRAPGNLPFHEDALEAKAVNVNVRINGIEQKLIVPPIGMNGGPAAVFAAAGIYSR